METGSLCQDMAHFSMWGLYIAFFLWAKGINGSNINLVMVKIHLLFQALEMIHNIRDAFNEILEESDWMDEETKVVAKQKVQ